MTIRQGVIVGAGINEELVDQLPNDASQDLALATLIEAGMQPPSDRFDEIYLQLFALDLDDEAAIAAWVTEFDVFNVHALSSPEAHDGSVDHPYPMLQHYPLFDRGDDPTDLADAGVWWARSIEEESDEIRAAAGFGNDWVERERLKPVTVEEFRWRLSRSS
jgi:hypothetical protein